MNKQYSPEADRSPEIQEIIGEVPKAIVRWGIVVILGILLIVMAVSWFIRYPDLLNAKVTITTTPAPIAIVCKVSGNIVLLKKENARVSSGDLIGYIKSNTNPESVSKLEKFVSSHEHFSDYNSFGALGDLEITWAELVKADESFKLFLNNGSYPKQIAQLNQQKNSYNKLAQSQLSQQKLAVQELALMKEKFKTDSILFSQKVLSVVDFSQSKANWFLQMRNAKSIETSIINSEIQIDQINKQISDLKIKETEDNQRLELDIQSALNKLKAGIAKWKENYLFVSPIKGQLAYLGFLEDEQFLETTKPYFSVIPEHGNLIAKAELPIHGSGKVREGQSVNIRLENYPFEQFGIIRGKVVSISIIPGNDNYRITIELPQQLVTSVGKKIKFSQQLTGSTEIITEDLSLLNRFFYQFRVLLKR
ncbi:MAG: HlyD family efflux transporter periplasmic adaptor subunit [Cyclobacteriaceae bacterium]